jgi:hypothetical protein
MKRHGLSAAVLAALALTAPALYADEIQVPGPGPQAKVHTVVHGDTLWDIARAYLEDPFQWPKIWRDNDQVANPDLIYPGGMIRIPVGLLKPEVREAMVPKGAPPQALEVPVPKGSLNPLMVESAGFLTHDLDDVGEVMGTYEGRTLMGEGDTIFLKLGRHDNPEPGTRFTVVRPLHTVRHPGSLRSMGRLVEVLGVVSVTGQKGRAVQATVERSYDSITQGDLLLAYADPDVTVTEGTPDLTGVVVAARDDREYSAAGDVVYIDRGARDGLAPGMTLEVMAHEEKVEGAGILSSYHLPERHLATLRVLSVREGNATAKIVESTEPIAVGNEFRAAPAGAAEPADPNA